ncbi:MAG: WG repeat-containing protein [Clostridiales Family XIII bacterium]|nr:WG repeat-containing protein [Clostridiales Family XIII bacterium]
MDGNPLGEGFIYDDAWYFNEGVAAVEIGGEYGLIDTSGAYIIEPGAPGWNGIDFDAIRPVYEGLAGVDWAGREEHGIINKSGELVAIFNIGSIDMMQEYSEGLAPARQRFEGAAKWGFVNRYGETAVPMRYDQVYPFEGGLAQVGLNGKFGLVDGRGDAVVPAVYDEIGDFHDGAAYVAKNGKAGFVKSSGKMICDTVYEYAVDFSDGLAGVCYEGLWGTIDLGGAQVAGHIFEGIKSYSCGLAPAKFDGKWGYIDTGGFFVIPPAFDDAAPFSEGRAAVLDNGRRYFIRMPAGPGTGNAVGAGLIGRAVDENGAAAARAAVRFYEAADVMMYKPLNSVYTDENGMYRAFLPEGAYKAVISAEGHEKSTLYLDNIDIINGNSENYAPQAVLPKSGRAGAEGVARVNIADAFTGDGIEGVEVRFRRGLDNTGGAWVRGADGGIVSTNTDRGGRFSVRLPYGAYTAEASMPGYVTAHVNFSVSELSGSGGIATKAMTRELAPGEIRVVLEWGAEPQDLDAHLVGPAPGGGKAHVYFPDSGGAGDAALSSTCATGNGFETLTIYARPNSEYSYSVFDRTNGEYSASYGLPMSGARVSVYRNAGREAVYDVPAGQPGSLWNVFRLENGGLTAVNDVTARFDLSFYTY